VARTKSEDKRRAILDAALSVFAERGTWSTPTAAISRAAGVAEGTLFTYFPTKEILMNELYRDLKSELAEILLASFPSDGDVRTRFQHLWQGYIRWGVTHPDELKVLAQLQVADQITPESREVGRAPFVEIERIATEAIAHGYLHDYPVAYHSMLFDTLAEMTIAVIASEPNTTVDYAMIGFDVLWRGTSRS